MGKRVKHARILEKEKGVTKIESWRDKEGGIEELREMGKRLSSQIKSHSSIDSTNINKLRANEHVPAVKTELWPLFVRMISFFLVKTRYPFPLHRCILFCL